MALSGMIQKTFYEPGGVARFAYRLYWSATQNIANNTSTVTVTAKLAGLISTSTIVSGHSNSASTVVLAGTTTSTNNNISISGITEKTMHTTSKTITHNTNGTGSFTLSGTQVINATFNGTYVGTVSIGSTTLTLDTIPRASTFTALSNFTTGSNPTCTIRRQSTAFTNTVRIKVGSTTIKTLTGQGDLNSLPLNDTTSINAIINALPNAASGTLTVEVDTMSGSTKIGSTVSRTSTITIAGSSFTALGNFTTGSNPTCTIRRSSTLISHTIRVKLGSTLIKTLTGQGDLNSIVVNDSVNTIINGLPNSTTGTITVEVDAMHGTAKIGSTLSRTCTVTINSSILPTLTSITHSEQNSTVSSIVGAYVQGLSSIKLTLNGAAGGQGSSIKGYEVKYNNAIVSHTVNIMPSASGTIPISARVQDNRSRWSTPLRTATAKVLAYRAPAIVTFTVQRSNSSGTVQAAGTSAKVVINANVQSLMNGTEKNSITATTYYRLKGASTWTLAKTTTGTTSISTNFVLSTFALANAYEWRLVVTDKFQSQESIVQMGTGKVIAAIAPDGRFGIGQFPEAGKALTVGGALQVNGAITINGFESIYTSNLDTTFVSGQYYYTNSTIGRPSPYGYVDVTVSAGSTYNGTSNWIWQTAYTTDGLIYQRRRINNGSWNSWVRISDTTYGVVTTGANGLMSAADKTKLNGIATGATADPTILTSTSGGTARCIRYANGWQEIYWRRTHTTTLTLPSGSTFYSNSPLASAAWPWPFIETPFESMPLVTGNTQLIWASVSSPGTATNSPTVYVYRGSANSNSVTYTIELRASGKWK